MRSSVRSRLAPPTLRGKTFVVLPGRLAKLGGSQGCGLHLVHENTYSRTLEASIVRVLSDIVKRGSYRAYEHERSCAYVHVLPQQLVAADILARRRSSFSRKRESGRRRDIRQRSFCLWFMCLRARDLEAECNAVGAILRSKAGLSVMFSPRKRRSRTND
jgi:hypothetical protein